MASLLAGQQFVVQDPSLAYTLDWFPLRSFGLSLLQQPVRSGRRGRKGVPSYSPTNLSENPNWEVHNAESRTRSRGERWIRR